MNLENRARNNGTQGRLHHILANPGHIPDEPPTSSDYITCDFPVTVTARNQRRDASDCLCDSLSVSLDQGLANYHTPLYSC